MPDSKKTGDEACDDGNGDDGDGCSSTCQVEPGYDCPALGEACIKSECGNGKQEVGEKCDCGTDPDNLPGDCKAVNGLFYGDGSGCSKTCTAEPNCLDSDGKTQACSTNCGDGNVDVGEECDDGDPDDGDGCSHDCKLEDGFTCETTSQQDSTTCSSGSGQCLELPMIYRDFQGENVTDGGHPDFPFYGTKFNGSKPTTICVPNSGGPVKGNDSTTRCWGIMADNLLKGKPQPGPTKTCACQFSDWNIANSSRIPGNYTLAGNDSPLSDASGGVQGGDAGSTVNTTSTGGPYTGTITGYTASDPGGPIWKGTAPAYKDAASFNQWFNDDPKVNQTFVSVLELSSIGSNIYQYASKSHLAEGGFFPLDELNPSQVTLCNLWPYWNHGNGQPIWSTCSGDQYLFIPRVTSTDCVSGDSVDDGCWVTAVTGVKHDYYFTDEARYYFVYDSTATTICSSSSTACWSSTWAASTSNSPARSPFRAIPATPRSWRAAAWTRRGTRSAPAPAPPSARPATSTLRSRPRLRPISATAPSSSACRTARCTRSPSSAPTGTRPSRTTSSPCRASPPKSRTACPAAATA